MIQNLTLRVIAFLVLLQTFYCQSFYSKGKTFFRLSFSSGYKCKCARNSYTANIGRTASIIFYSNIRFYIYGYPPFFLKDQFFLSFCFLWILKSFIRDQNACFFYEILAFLSSFLPLIFLIITLVLTILIKIDSDWRITFYMIK